MEGKRSRPRRKKRAGTARRRLIVSPVNDLPEEVQTVPAPRSSLLPTLEEEEEDFLQIEIYTNSITLEREELVKLPRIEIIFFAFKFCIHLMDYPVPPKTGKQRVSTRTELLVKEGRTVAPSHVPHCVCQTLQCIHCKCEPNNVFCSAKCKSDTEKCLNLPKI